METQAIWKLASKIACVFILIGRKPDIGESRSDLPMLPDHIHMLESILPKYRISQFMGYLKGKSALTRFDKHANLKYKFGNR